MLLFAALALITTVSPVATALTCSDMFRIVAPTTASRATFIRARNSEIELDLQQSPNRSIVEQMVRERLSENPLRREYDIGGGVKIQISHRGPGSPFEIIRVERGRSVVLFTTRSPHFTGQNHLSTISFSPDKQTLVLSFAQNGSTDLFRLIPISTREPTVLTARDAQQNIQARQADVAWISNEHFLFTIPTVRPALALGQYSMRRQTFDVEHGSMMKEGPRGWVAVWRQGLWWALSTTGERIPMTKEHFDDFIAVNNGAIFLRDSVGLGQGRIVRLSPARARETDGPNQARMTRRVIRREYRFLTHVELKDDYLISTTRWGDARWIEARTLNGRLIGELKVPDCCAVSSVQWQTPGRVLKIRLQSPVRTAEVFHYDLTTGRWLEESIESRMLTVGGIRYESSIEQVRSADGVLIPMRVTRRADLQRNGRNPVLMEAYGGFEKVGSIDPTYDPMVAIFIQRGGVWATPAIRGGGEFGVEWHRQGSRRNKSASVDDLITSARWLSEQNWTEPRRIIATGASHGGYVTAAAGLRGPEVFGLIIPVVGVHDLFNKENLNPGNSWISEWGDARLPEIRERLAPITPLELARTARHPEFLVIGARNDTRVNAEHSFRLTEELLSNPTPGVRVRMFSSAGGHWQSGSMFRDHNSLRTQVVMWTRIFDHSSMNLASPVP